MNHSKRVAVIGAGASGLTSIKSLKDEGQHPVCFEKASNIGGVWRYHENVIEGIPSIPWYTFMDHSKETWTFSDFPPRKDLPNFMNHWEVYNYLSDYARHFDLLKHIQFNKEVTKVSKSLNYDVDGKWIITIMHTENKVLEEEEFDGVFVCSGHLWDPCIPTFIGMDKFQGTVTHTHDLKRVDKFSDKTVLVIGNGSAGFDAATQISNVAKRVYLCVKDGAWIFPCLGPRGIPNDIYLLRRIYHYLSHIIPKTTMCKYIERSYIDLKLNHHLYNLQSKYSLIDANPVINDNVGFAICSGKIIVKKKIRNFRDHGVVFEEEERDTFVEIDDVILGTGYNWKFPFLDKGIMDVVGFKIDLYKCVYPLHLQHGTLAFIGFIKPIGPTFPIFEIQSRWASSIVAKRNKLPSRKCMMLDVAIRYDANLKRFPKNRWLSLMVDYTLYLEDIASKIGVKPNLLKLLILDPKLFYACFFETITSYQYRLQGPNSWSRARETILTTHDRIMFPLIRKNYISARKQKPKWSLFRKILTISFIYVIYRIIRFISELKRNPKLKYYIIIKIFPYVNKIQQIIYSFRDNNVVK